MLSSSALPSKTDSDPIVPDWKSTELEKSWADALDLASPKDLVRFFKLIFGDRKPVTLPEQIASSYNIPKYIQQEFHNLPNGNYSQRFSHGYITGFDISLGGFAKKARGWIAEQLRDLDSIVDVGTAGGKTAALLKANGAKDVWGVDPSPYLLKHADEKNEGINFVHGIAEDLPFADARMDGIAVCFVFHEIPPKYAVKALAEFNRILKMGGRVAIVEPSKKQLDAVQLKSLFSRIGWQHLYFRTLANFVHEPFLMPWHKTDKEALFKTSGFKVLEHQDEMPLNAYCLEKIS